MDVWRGGILFFILCAISFDVVLCFVHTTESSTWPAGTYALPMADSGCPEGSGFNWYTGHRTEELERDQNENKHSPSIHLRTEIGKPEIKRYFCVKNSTKADEGKPKWPNGKYCIYKKGDFCPQGFHKGSVLWDDDNANNGFNLNSKGGELPSGLYNQDTKIYFCCMTTGSVEKRVSLPVNKPFYLLAFESTTCQEVRGAVYALEYVVFDTENSNNQDARAYPYPYGANLRQPTIYYCYYRECNWNFNQSSGVFASPYFPDKYHDFHDCQWNITAPRGYIIQLRFGVFELESNPNSCGNGRCSCDYVEVKEESEKGLVTTLGRYCMTNLPLSVIQSSTNKMIVTFYSDQVISAKGFNASYTSVPGPDFTTEPTESQATRTTTRHESSTKRQSLLSSDLSKTPEGKQTERREATSVKTTKHTHGTQTSGDVEPHSSVFTDIPLKYILIASGSFVVILFALLLLVYHLFKRRLRSSTKRAQKGNQYNSVKESSGSSAPASALISEMEQLFSEDKLSDNPIYGNSLIGTTGTNSKDQFSENPLYERMQ